MSIVLDIRDLSIWAPTPAGPALIVDRVNLAVRKGTVHGIAGESGSGKTMTVMSLLGLLPKTMVREGEIRLEGDRVSELSKAELRELRGGRISMVFQDPMTSLHPTLTIGKQMTEHLAKHLGVKKKEAKARAAALLREVRIPDPTWSLDAYPHQFSGGMRQRIAVAMALTTEPTVLIADEPTTALDVTVQAGILRLLDRLRQDHGLSIVYITHDLGVMAAIADDLTIMYAGRVVETGAAATILERPQHPYTDELLKSLPKPERARREGKRQPLVAIEGDAATPLARPRGCAFHPRCPEAIDSCSEQIPTLERFSDDQQAACPVKPFAGKLIR